MAVRARGNEGMEIEVRREEPQRCRKMKNPLRETEKAKLQNHLLIETRLWMSRCCFSSRYFTRTRERTNVSISLGISAMESIVKPIRRTHLVLRSLLNHGPLPISSIWTHLEKAGMVLSRSLSLEISLTRSRSLYRGDSARVTGGISKTHTRKLLQTLVRKRLVRAVPSAPLVPGRKPPTFNFHLCHTSKLRRALGAEAPASPTTSTATTTTV